jgi:hypothetical protein
LPGKKGLQISGDHLIKNRLFRNAGGILPDAFTNDEIGASRHECAMAGGYFLRK